MSVRMPWDICDVELSEAKRQVAELRLTGRFERVEYVNRRPEDGRQYARVYVWVPQR